MDQPDGESRNLATVRPNSRMEKAVLIILICIATAALLVFTIGRARIHRKKPAAAPAMEKAVVPPDSMEPQALEALEAFFEAPDLESKAGHVKDALRVLPMMRDYHVRREHPFPTMGSISKGHVTGKTGFPMVLFQVEPFSGPRYPVAVAWDGRRFAVDWESLTAYGTIDWSEFIERKPAEKQTMRVYILSARASDALPSIPPGSKEFRIEHRDDPQTLVAIASGETAAMLAPLVERSRTPVTLELAWKPLANTGLPVPEIVRLVATGWSR